jgi:hypothetical protein
LGAAAAQEADRGALRHDFDRRLLLQFGGSAIISDGGLLAYRELDDVLALTANGGERLAEARIGRNRRHLLVGLLRQSVFGRLAGYEDMNDAERLSRDPAMRWVVDGNAPTGRAASDTLGNFMRTLAMPKSAEPWSLTSLREKLIKIGAKVVSHGRYVMFEMAEVAVSRQMFVEILSLIARLRAPPAPA